MIILYMIHVVIHYKIGFRVYLFVLLLVPYLGFGQLCPPNLDAEFGDFANWQCYGGTVAAGGNTNVISVNSSGPLSNQHLVYSNQVTSVDAYGQFPLSCPNGSGYSIKLGNDEGGKFAERVSYTFNIPANANEYSLLYWYAVVFQNPNHEEYQQPRFMAKVYDESSGEEITCASFTYVGSSGLPGFQQSSVNHEIIFKSWTPVTVNLNGLADHRIKIEFTTSDCTQGGHFGYAYVDVNSSCTQPVKGATYCEGVDAITLQAPFGFKNYAWLTASGQFLSDDQTLNLSPPPADGTKLLVALQPYDGFGCVDTLSTIISQVAQPIANAGPDAFVCENSAVQMGTQQNNAWQYQWIPSTGLSNPTGGITLTKPKASTLYKLAVTDSTGGCTVWDSVLLTILRTPVSDFDVQGTCEDLPTKFINRTVYTGTSPINYEWIPMPGDTIRSSEPIYTFPTAGLYSVQLRAFSQQCPNDISNSVKSILIAEPPTGKRAIINAVLNRPAELSTENKGVAYQWSPASYLNNSQAEKPIFTSSQSTLYEVLVRNSAGCTVKDTVEVRLFKEANIWVPTAFTPNGDGKNDQLRPVLVGVRKFISFKVWNRMGEMVFQTSREGEGWKGCFNGKVQDTANFVWIVEAISVTGERIFKKGNAVLIR